MTSHDLAALISFLVEDALFYRLSAVFSDAGIQDPEAGTADAAIHDPDPVIDDELPGTRLLDALL